jgi:hypothetical protein
MGGDRQHRPAVLLERVEVEIDEGPEPPRIAPDDRQRQRQAVAGGTADRVRTAADADPGSQRARLDRRVDLGGTDRRARRAAPGHLAALEELDEERQPILEQLVIARQIEAEQRI